MGEIAEMMLEGILDEYTGEYLGDAVGYPRSLDPRHPCNQHNTEHEKILTDAQRARRRRARARQRKNRAARKAATP